MQILEFTEWPIREVPEAIRCMLSRTLDVMHKHWEMRQQWMRLVRNKLVPLKLLIPVGQGTHEWSRTYRDMIFEMALLITRYGGEVTPELIRKFMRRPSRNDIAASFSEFEIGLLMRKSVEYNLPVHRFSPPTAVSRGAGPPLRTEAAPLQSEKSLKKPPRAG
jgi:hypothetical protein